MYALTAVVSLAAALTASALPHKHEPKVHEVLVGGPSILRYTPSFVHANPGDIVRFQFLEKNHTATQSSFESPCAKSDGGFDSGFKPNPNNTSPGPASDFQVKDDKPVWFYCRQGTHCSSGMVFAINPTVEKSFTQFFSNALATKQGAPAPIANQTAPSVTATAKYTAQVTARGIPTRAPVVASSGIPPELTSYFDRDLGLKITYPFGQAADGTDQTGKDTTKVPKFALGDSAGVNTANAKFVIAMIDIDATPGDIHSARLHYLKKDFVPNGDATKIASDTKPTVPYVGPDATPANGVASHRYVFLLFRQPRNFVDFQNIDANDREGFDVAKFMETNRIYGAVSGTHFTTLVN